MILIYDEQSDIKSLLCGVKYCDFNAPSDVYEDVCPEDSINHSDFLALFDLPNLKVAV